MSHAPNDGGPAFPVSGFVYPNDELQHPDGGMTLRDYFAAKAMQAAISSPKFDVKAEMSNVARDAYRQADAMLAAREAS